MIRLMMSLMNISMWNAVRGVRVKGCSWGSLVRIPVQPVKGVDGCISGPTLDGSMADPFDEWKTKESDPCPYCGWLGHPVGGCPDGLADAAERRAEAERDEAAEWASDEKRECPESQIVRDGHGYQKEP
jgi:hypothetical protein